MTSFDMRELRWNGGGKDRFRVATLDVVPMPTFNHKMAIVGAAIVLVGLVLMLFGWFLP
jgi:hypothetical protein